MSIFVRRLYSGYSAGNSLVAELHQDFLGMLAERRHPSHERFDVCKVVRRDQRRDLAAGRDGGAAEHSAWRLIAALGGTEQRAP